MLQRFALGPYAGDAQPSEHDAVAALLRAHPPDMPLGLGTTAFRLTGLLRDFGFQVRHRHGGLFAHDAARVLAEARTHTAAGWPVPVCVDDGLLGGRAFEAHWALLQAVGDSHVTLSHARVTTLPLREFYGAWVCRALPWTHNACALLAER